MAQSSYESEYFRKESEINKSFLIGVILAVSSSVFIGSSFIIKKISLLKLSKTSSLRAGAGGFGYLRDWVWWAGLLSMGLGELLNLIAYGFAPAALVTPLGALSVVISAVLASKFLQEYLTTLGKVGCVLCIIGSILIICNAPRDLDAEDILVTKNLEKTPVIIYTFFSSLLCIFLMCCLSPEYGNKFVLVYVIVCSVIGSFTVVASQVLSLSIREELQGDSLGYKVILISFSVLITCVCIQMAYLNKALDIFGTTVVTPIYYVMFTTLVLLFNSLLFGEWKHMTAWNTIGTIVGLIIAFFAIFLLHAKKEKTGAEYLLKNGDSFRYN
ncbi:hypothetical protein WA026_007108 [Henosepilachna vigintioctopunctata]|uniref:Magnesium transporter n=1 Tax=Henosepilachna vigintioctopunctata TaxID=420089 RepID=A0AAW1VBQ5_9CUCU